MTPERRTEIRERAESVRTWKAVWGPPIPQLCDVDIPDLLDEVERLHAELALAFSPGMYLDIQKVLDKALGTNEADGAGAGIVADIALVADRMRQAATERDTARAELAEERARHGELVAEMQRARTEAERRRDELDALTDRLDVAVTHAAADRHNSAAEARALRQENTTLRAEQVRLAEQVRVLAGLLRRGNPKVFCSKHPDHVEPGCEVCRDAGIFRSALGEQDGDQTDG